MNFDLHLYGETPEELLNVLAHLGHMDSNYHTPIPNERHPAQAPAPQPQNDPAPQSEKQKAPAPAKPKKPAQKPAAVPAEKKPEKPTDEPQANPTTPATPPTAAPDEPQADPSAQGAPSKNTATGNSEPEKDPVTENKIRSLIMALMKQGKQAECKRIITGTGAKGISSLPPESYASVWEQLYRLKDEVDANAAD